MDPYKYILFTDIYLQTDFQSLVYKLIAHETVCHQNNVWKGLVAGLQRLYSHFTNFRLKLRVPFHFLYLFCIDLLSVVRRKNDNILYVGETQSEDSDVQQD